MRASEMPSVFNPGSCATKTGVTFDPNWFAVLPGWFKPVKRKSFSFTKLGSLQTKPFTNTARSLHIYGFQNEFSGDHRIRAREQARLLAQVLEWAWAQHGHKSSAGVDANTRGMVVSTSAGTLHARG
ncbi:hypothetical protein M5K25_012261 [Dendrobium thyrsiflorum]|uniref:Uncharacterized protein n=1 Tax=Dendrobium thyrsiflorum TaxID=117978 RepID=A0ABD0UX91_DENTH